MRIATSRFGMLECPDDRLLTLPAGILGFPRSTRYVILDHDREVPFKWLQSCDESEVAFVIANPTLFDPKYRVVVSEPDTYDLAAQAADDLLIFVIVTIPADDPSRLTGNLRGPVVVNQRTRVAKQIILKDEYPTRCGLTSDAPSAEESPTVELAGAPRS